MTTQVATHERRRDIQGLRAVAVALVFCVHVWYAQVGGGFLGVDVFLVISGYLITRSLTDELSRTGTVRVPTFWARRISRLLPAAFIVLAVCAVFALTHPASFSVSDQLWSDVAGAAYVLNWFRVFGILGAALIGHYWTLSVEEQFYVVWPLVLLLAAIASRRLLRRGSRPGVVIAAAIVAAASLGYAAFEVARNPELTYMATTTRAWEFAVGGLVSMLPVPRWGARRWTHGLFLGLSWAMILLLALAVMHPGPKDPATMPLTLPWMAVLAAAVLVWVGDSDSPWSPQFVLHAGPIQYLGDVSYAVYLWHVPLIAMIPVLIGPHSALVTVGVIVITTIGLATLSKYFVEDPLRRFWRAPKRLWQPFAFAATGIAVLVVVAIAARLLRLG